MTARYPLVLTALVAADATAAFEAAMLTSAVPELITEFQLRTTDAGWAFTAFTLTAAAAAAIGGRLGETTPDRTRLLDHVARRTGRAAQERVVRCGTSGST